MVRTAHCEGANGSHEVLMTASSGSSLQSPEDHFLGELGVMAVQRFLLFGDSFSWEQTWKGEDNAGRIQWEIPPR